MRNKNVLFTNSGFVNTYKVFIKSTLESLVKQMHSIAQAYCCEEYQEFTRIPRFYLLSKRLELSQKVTCSRQITNIQFQ